MQKENLKGSLVTFGASGLSLLLMAPADIFEVSSWLPKFMLARSGTSLGNFIDACEVAVAIGGPIFLLFRKPAPVWLKTLLWALFIVAVVGVVRVETELAHWH
jgi:hypothetical protein